jgi:hypothetical protein
MKPDMPIEPIDEIYLLRYNKQTVQTVNFYAKNLLEAIELGKKYCDEFRLRFIHVGPLAVRLEDIIRAKQESGG